MSLTGVLSSPHTIKSNKYLETVFPLALFIVMLAIFLTYGFEAFLRTDSLTVEFDVLLLGCCCDLLGHFSAVTFTALWTWWAK